MSTQAPPEQTSELPAALLRLGRESRDKSSSPWPAATRRPCAALTCAASTLNPAVSSHASDLPRSSCHCFPEETWGCLANDLPRRRRVDHDTDIPARLKLVATMGMQSQQFSCCAKPWFVTWGANCTPCNKPWFHTGCKLHPENKPWFAKQAWPWFVVMGGMLAARRPPDVLAVVPGHTSEVEAGCHDGHV